MTEREFLIKGMNCGHCVMALKKEFAKLNLTSANVEIGKANLSFDESQVTEELIESAVKEAGFELVK